MTELDTMLSDALHADAERAPSMPPEWAGPATATIVPIATHRPARRIAVAAAGIAAAAAAVTVLALVTRPDDPTVRVPATEPVPTPWQPPGTEYPLTDLGPATESQNGPVVEALTRSIQVDGHPVQTVTTSLTYSAGATAELEYCTWEGGSGGCRPEWNPVTWSFGITSSVDNRVADFDLLTIEGVPADVAFVGYVDGDTELWQRPIAGFAAFPDVPGSDEVVTAWDPDGALIGTYDSASTLAVGANAVQPPRADISQGYFNEFLTLTWSSLETCLTERGGTIGSGDVVTFPEGVDQVAVWDECVIEVKATVAQAVAELEPRFYDPRTERPQNPASPFTFGD